MNIYAMKNPYKGKIIEYAGRKVEITGFDGLQGADAQTLPVSDKWLFGRYLDGGTTGLPSWSVLFGGFQSEEL